MGDELLPDSERHHKTKFRILSDPPYHTVILRDIHIDLIDKAYP